MSITNFLQSPLVISCGDPSGVGLEVTIKAYHSREKHHLPPFILIANPKHIEDFDNQIGTKTNFTILDKNFTPEDVIEIFNISLPVYPLSDDFTLSLGEPKAENAKLVINSIKTAFDLCIHGKASGMVTAPIQKSNLIDSGFAFPGHTEFLEHLSQQAGYSDAKSMMLLASKQLKVVPFTIHIPLSKVPENITEEGLYRSISQLNQALKDVYAIENPKIAVCALNPHAGENGNMGHEEIEIIIPAMNKLKADKVNVIGPLAADSMFHEHARKLYDCAVGMYHDQVLIPLKALAFDQGVNVTLGLPILRTSPDHGTALEIADKGIASAMSMISAIQHAGYLANQRINISNT